MIKKRISWEEYFLLNAQLIAQRSTCLRRQVGAVIVSKGNRILSTGYNGSPEGAPHCLDSGCMRDALGIPSGHNTELCWATHAEANAVANAARMGVSVLGGTIYSTHKPCIECLKLLKNAGIKHIRYWQDYPSPSFYDTIVESTGITLRRLENE